MEVKERAAGVSVKVEKEDAQVFTLVERMRKGEVRDDVRKSREGGLLFRRPDMGVTASSSPC